MYPKSKREQLAEDLAGAHKYETRIRTMNMLQGQTYDRTLNVREKQVHREQITEAGQTTDLEMAEMREFKRMQNERLAEEMDRQNRLCLRDAKLRQQIRANNQDLRDLELKLRAGYVSKGIRAQLDEHNAEREQERRQQLREQEERQLAMNADAENQMAQKQGEKQRQAKFRQALQEQIMNKREHQQKLYREFLAEKEELDALVRRVYEEQMSYVFFLFFFSMIFMELLQPQGNATKTTETGQFHCWPGGTAQTASRLDGTTSPGDARGKPTNRRVFGRARSQRGRTETFGGGAKEIVVALWRSNGPRTIGHRSRFFVFLHIY